MPPEIPISIITVNYNDAAGLKRTLQSVSNQDFQDFEHIVIDGNSQDDSTTVLQEASYDQLEWVSEPDAGIYDAMNKGIASAHGKYLLFLNSGDTLHTHQVLGDVRAALSLDKDIVYGDLWIQKNHDEGFRNRYPETIDFPFLQRTSLGHASTFIKRSLFTTYGRYRTDLKIVSDWAFFIKVLCEHRVSQYKVPMIIATFYEGGVSTAPEAHQTHLEERKKVLIAYFDLYEESFQNLMMVQEKNKRLLQKVDARLPLVASNPTMLRIVNWTIALCGDILKWKRKRK